jgi:hypothetical protein
MKDFVKTIMIIVNLIISINRGMSFYSDVNSPNHLSYAPYSPMYLSGSLMVGFLYFFVGYQVISMISFFLDKYSKGK